MKTLQPSEHMQFIIDKADKLECLDSNVHREKVEYSVIGIMMHTRFAGSQ